MRNMACTIIYICLIYKVPETEYYTHAVQFSKLSQVPKGGGENNYYQKQRNINFWLVFKKIFPGRYLIKYFLH